MKKFQEKIRDGFIFSWKNWDPSTKNSTTDISLEVKLGVTINTRIGKTIFPFNTIMVLQNDFLPILRRNMLWPCLATIWRPVKWTYFQYKYAILYFIYIKACVPKSYLFFQLFETLGNCAEGFWIRLISFVRINGRKDKQSVKSHWSVLHSELTVHSYIL